MITSELIEQVYEAAAVPELWPSVLDDIAGLNSSIGGLLFVSNDVYAGWTASAAMRPIFQDFVDGGWLALNPRPGRAIALNRMGFVDDFDLFTAAEMDADPTYQYLRQQNVGWCSGTTVTLPSGDTLVFSWERHYGDGPFDRGIVRALDPLRPHLARAALIAGRLGLARARATTETLGMIGLPAAVLSRGQQAVIVNDLFARLVPHVFQDRRERLTLADANADALLKGALARVKSGITNGQNSFPARGVDGAPHIVHLLPIARSAQDIFSAASCIVVVTTIAAATTPPAAIIQALFDLSPAEARVAAKIVGGEAIDEIASGLGIAVATVRSQLRSIFGKTGVSRQGELIALLKGVALPLQTQRS
jgi:DNA-binding CsgD family transcriptional regulator